MKYFDDYVGRYDMNISEINYKYYHSYRVMDNMIVIAKSMNLSLCDVELAKCIGILHDIGRFEQFKRFKSFNDLNMDHGDYGEEVLRQENALKHFDIKEEDYEVVYKAIRNHNKYQIEPNLNKRELLFAKMIRDADKLDILYAICNTGNINIMNEDDRINNIYYLISSDQNNLNELKSAFGNNIESQLLKGELSDELLDKIENFLCNLKSKKSIIPLSKRFQIQNRAKSNSVKKLKKNIRNSSNSKNNRFIRKKLSLLNVNNKGSKKSFNSTRDRQNKF